MKLAPQYEFNESQLRTLRRARLLEWATLGYLAIVIVLMYIVMGSSQAMKTAWIEDMLSLVPPALFIIGSHVCWKEPTNKYPFGFHRVVSLLFLFAALSLLSMGIYLLIDGLVKLLSFEYPSIGRREYFGCDMWLGWWMILVLVLASVPPVVLGRFKVRLAEDINDKILITDGKMNKADWMTGAAAMAGVVGIGLGWWWADAVAAIFISFDILRDGLAQTRDAFTSLVNRAPKTVHNKDMHLEESVRQKLLKFPWIDEVEVRLVEHGHMLFGEGFVEVKDESYFSPVNIRLAMNAACESDWRLREFSISPMPK